ncbi:MAG TPA: hypothetical protein VMJ72_01435 [Candidatus Paceibacterota bacterium]|nr:hypothetical protein [Candidatus Paceibacterota bacterium]
MKFRLFVAALAAGALTALGACNRDVTGPNAHAWGKIVVSTPREGQTFSVNGPIPIVWRCDGDCASFVSRELTIYFRTADPDDMLQPIGSDFLTGSRLWTPAPHQLAPGLYILTFYTDTIWVSPTGGYTEAYGESGVFRLQ